MFEEPGHKIKLTAKVLFWLSMVGAVILGFVFGKDRYGDFAFGTFTLIVVSGAAASFVSSLVLYGIGDAIEDISNLEFAIRHATDRVLEKIDELETTQGKEDTPNAPRKPVEHSSGPFNLADYIN